MSLDFDITHRLGAFKLDARFLAGSGLTALFGRSGAGKTSVVNIIAGLIKPERGRVSLDGLALVDTEARIFVPRHRRRLGYVFQDARLFPHLTVRQNLAYGSWFSESNARPAVSEDVLDLLGLEHLLERRPARLSGGEKQRVAIGRALLARPALLLMDEPLASLDDARRVEILPVIERLRDFAGIPIVYVSHSVAEVARLATTVVVMSEGGVAAVGPAGEIMQRLDLFPLTGRAEAGSVIEAIVEGHDAALGLSLLRSKAGLWRLPRIDLATGSRLRLRVRARDVMLATKRPEGISALNIFSATVTELVPREGGVVDLRLDSSGESLLARVTRHSVGELGLGPGSGVFALVKSVAFDRHSLSGPLRSAELDLGASDA